MATYIVYPDADPESTSVDGIVREATPDAPWATMRGAAGDAATDDGTVANNDWIATAAGSPDYTAMGRLIFLFDTSALPTGADISAATLSLKVVFVSAITTIFLTWSSARLGISIVSSAPASNTALAAGDFDCLGTTKYTADVEKDTIAANIAAGDPTDFTFNATGIAAIAPDGITKLGARITADCDNNPGSWESSRDINYNVRLADYTGTTDDPTLTITYTGEGIPRPIFF